MDYNYIIEVTMPDTGEVRYLTRYNNTTTNPLGAKRYCENSEEALRKLRYLSRELNPRLIDRRMKIGTYISTYRGKYRLSNILEIIEANDFLLAITMPILLPIALTIVGIRTLKDKYNQYVTNHR